MIIEFIPINYNNPRDCELIAKWFNDPELNYLITPNFSPGPMPTVTPESIYQSNVNSSVERYAYFILCDGKIIGDVNITDNPDYLLDHKYNSAWLGISIADKDYQNRGIGKHAMTFIEQRALELGFERIELGVFSFNTRAIKFYQRLGYQYIGRVPHFTFNNGQWHDDVRYEKFISFKDHPLDDSKEIINTND